MNLSAGQFGTTRKRDGHFSGVQAGIRPQRLYLVNHLGFTLTELIATIVIVGILAAVAIPRFFVSNSFSSRGYYDQVIATLRHAQKVAIAQHHFVCVTFTPNSVELTIDPVMPGTAHTSATCPGNNLFSPAGVNPYVVTAPSGVTVDGTTFSFDALGKPNFSSAQSVGVSGYSTVTVEAETGYVH